MRSTLIPFAAFVVLSGCAATSSLKQFYDPYDRGLMQNHTSAKHVQVIDGEWNSDKSTRLKQNLIQRGYWILGSLDVVGPLQSTEVLADFVASVGGDLVIRKTLFVGMKQGSRMAIGSYTPGTVITSSHSDSVNAYSTGSGYVNSPGSTSYFSGQQSTRAYGAGTSTTYIPGQTTYVRENYEYPSYVQVYTIMQSETTFRKNAGNFRKYLSAARGYTLSDLDFAIFINKMVAGGKAKKLDKLTD